MIGEATVSFKSEELSDCDISVVLWAPGLTDTFPSESAFLGDLSSAKKAQKMPPPPNDYVATAQQLHSDIERLDVLQGRDDNKTRISQRLFEAATRISGAWQPFV
jgi:hypothetical protein